MLQNNIYVAVVCWLSAVLSLIAIFFFKNTRLQKKVCWLCIVLIIAATASEWLAVNGLDVSGAEGISWNAVVCAPFIVLAALIGAIRCIRSDEKKLSSYDRLR